MNKKNNTTIDIKTGFQCNNNCKFCAQGNQRNFRNNFSTEQIKKILIENKTIFDNVVLTGGEITIRSDFLELVKFAKNCNYKNIFIQSNGRMFSYVDLCEKVAEIGVNNFYLSLHGSTPEIHDGLTRVAGSFEQTIKGIKNLINLGQKVSTNTVVTKINYMDMPNVAELLSKLNVFSFQFSFMDINSVIEKNKEEIDIIVPRYKDVKESVEKGLQIGLDFNSKCKTESFPFCSLSRKYYDCIPFKRMEDYFVRDGERTQNMTEIRNNKLKKQGEKCKQCKV